jgi:hypothetical protein
VGPRSVTLPEVIEELNRLGRVAQGIQNRYSAHFQLHVAACLNKDEQEMRVRRDELHTLLDALLDNAEAIQRTQDELQVIANRGG